MVQAFNSALQTIIEETKTNTEKTPMTNVVIEDVLSDYVVLDGSNVAVTSDDASEVVKFTVNEASDNKVKVTIDELKDGNTYTLQFNVKPSDKAKEEANGANAADVTKFDANRNATLSYNYGSETVNGTYAEKPQIAVAKEKVYTVTFVNAVNQENLGSQKVKAGETATKPADPTLDGYTFKGWYATENETYNFANPVTGDTTVYAQFEENAAPVDSVSTVPVTKVLAVEGTTVVPNADFSFTVTPLNGAPAIASAKTSSSNAQTLKDGKVSLTTQLDLSKVVWPQAGDYEYTIQEDKTGYTNKAGRDEMSYDENTYTLRVRVVDNNGTLVPTIALYVDNSKVSATDDGKVDEIVFQNTFKHTDPVKETLTIKKNVTGEDADNTKKFHFTVTFDKVLNTDGTDVNVGAVTEEFELSATDEPISFSVPEGTKYTVTEAGTENWTGSVSVNGGTSVVAGKGETVSTGEVTVDPSAEDQVVFLNTYNKPESPLTGFVKKNAAVFLAGILAIAVFAAYVFDRKRKAERKAARE
ncbi:MAG: InlB B-repeat-containing protein [Clostridia bacterium]|nr:InlB B-repeat-containing protein [Clostridia bacterium]